MKIELVDKDSFSIFINRLYIKECDFSSKQDITDVVKELVYQLKGKLHLCGFYKIKVFVHDKIGLFLDVFRLEELDYSNTLDLRIIIYFNEPIFFGVDDYFLIQDAKKIWFFDNQYYCLVDDILDQFYSLSEFGSFVYGKEAGRLLNQALIV